MGIWTQVIRAPYNTQTITYYFWHLLPSERLNVEFFHVDVKPVHTVYAPWTPVEFPDPYTFWIAYERISSDGRYVKLVSKAHSLLSPKLPYIPFHEYIVKLLYIVNIYSKIYYI